MREVETQLEAGVIVVPTSEAARYNEFWLSVGSIKVPKGTDLFHTSGLEFVRNLNNMVQTVLDQEDKKWIWLLGDDHTFDNDLLLNLLAHKKDIIVPMVAARKFPFDSVVVHGPIGEGHRYKWDEFKFDEKGLMRLNYGDTVGTAGMLLNKEVFRKLSYPWFRCGQVFSDIISEDIYLASKFWDYGYEIYVAEHYMTHITSSVIFPSKGADGKYHPVIGMLNDTNGCWYMGV